jgi:hypothetical protein
MVKFVILYSGGIYMSININIDDFLSFKNEQDFTPVVVAALKSVKDQKDITVTFSKNTYEFWPDYAQKVFYIISNNSVGIKNVVFHIDGIDGVTIECNNSKFIFHGEISPFIINKSNNVLIKNLSIDYDRPFHTEGRIINSTNEYVDLYIDENMFPYRVQDGKIIFYSDYWESDTNIDALVTEFDSKTKAPAYLQGYSVKHMTEKLDGNSKNEMTAEKLSDGNLRIYGYFRPLPIKDNILTFINDGRKTCAFFLNQSENVTITDVNIYHCGAMGLIAQMTKNITVIHLIIAPELKSGRIISIGADATHFVHCSGYIRMEDCVFDNMLDDATNIHGVYTIITKRISQNKIQLKYINGRLDIYRQGDKVNFIDCETLMPIGSGTITDIDESDSQNTCLTFEQTLPNNVDKGIAVENITQMPEKVLIRGCRTGNNRGRGFLLTTIGEVIIENNTFYNSFWAIEMAGDANYWYESGAVNNVLIQNNRFLNCGYIDNCTTICINPSIKKNGGYYHKNIVIRNNEFHCFNPLMLTARLIDGLEFTGNTYIPTNTYPPVIGGEKFKICECKNVNIQEI